MNFSKQMYSRFCAHYIFEKCGPMSRFLCNIFDPGSNMKISVREMLISKKNQGDYKNLWR